MEMAQGFGLDQRVLARVIATAALEDETARLGISVGDAELGNRIVDIPAFKGVNGKFDRDGYSFALQQSGLTEVEFEKSLRDEVSRQILQSAVANGVETQASFVDAIYGFARETRNFTWALIDDAQLNASVPEPTEDELNTYYAAHPDDFTLPKTKNITYAWLNPEDIIPSITVEESQIRALYDQRAEEYLVPERRLVERLVFDTKEAAQAASDVIEAGQKTFEQLVSERDLSLSDIDLGDLPKDELGAAGDAIFAMSEPGVSGPLDSEFGPALFRMNAILAARETSFDDARTVLHGELAADAARRQISDMITELDDEMASGVTIEELSESHNMRQDTIDWTAGASDGIAAYEAFRKAASEAEDGDFPTITLMADGGVFALRLDEVQAPRVQDLDEVKPAVRAGWEAQTRQALLAQQARDMIPDLEAGESLSSLGFTEVVEQNQTREAFITGAPATFMVDVFAMDTGEWRVLDHGRDVVMVYLDAVQAADQDSEEAKTLKDSFANTTAREIALDIENAFADAIQTRAGITINRDVINVLNAQIQ
jgi:peptidyl-prolyl cis-trans isomerase D